MFRKKTLALLLLLCWIPLQYLQAGENAFFSCDAVINPTKSLEIERLQADPALEDLLLITEEVVSLFASADRQQLIALLQKGDYESATRLAGFSTKDVQRLEERLAEAREELLGRHPELLDFMPRRVSPSTTQAAISILERLPIADHDGEPIIVPFSSPLVDMPRGHDGNSDSSSRGVRLKWGSPQTGPGLTPPPSFGGPGPCWGPDCKPGPMPEPPPEDDQIPPDVGDGVSCAWVPYIASLVGCAFVGAAASGATTPLGGIVAYGACGIVALCQFCNDPICD